MRKADCFNMNDHSWRVVILRCAAGVRSALSAFCGWSAVLRRRRRRCGPARLCARLRRRTLRRRFRGLPGLGFTGGLRFALPVASCACRRLGRLRLAGFRLGLHRRHISGVTRAAGACLGAGRRFLLLPLSSVVSVPSAARPSIRRARQLILLDRLPRVLAIRPSAASPTRARHRPASAVRAACTCRDSLCSVCSYTEP